MSAVLADLVVPVVQAPMAGGVGTPALAVAVSDAGGLGFLAAGYLAVDALRGQIAEVRRATTRPFGVNVFSPPLVEGDPDAIAGYARALTPWARAQGARLGTPRFDDDDHAAKIAVVVEQRPAVVSFTFGVPSPETTDRLHAAGVEVWVTVTDPREAAEATAAGAASSWLREQRRGDIAAPSTTVTMRRWPSPTSSSGSAQTGRSSRPAA